MTDIDHRPDPRPASNRSAELRLLGALVREPERLGDALQIMVAGDLYEPVHSELFDLLVAMRDERINIEPQTIADELRRRGRLEPFTSSGLLGNIVTDQAAIPESVGYYARQVLHEARLREQQRLGHGLLCRASKPDADPDATLEWLAEQQRALRDRSPAEIAVPDVWELASRDNTNEELIPGLLFRHDRVMIVGGEGHGKSYLGMQLAAGMAAGIHPFRLTPQKPGRALVVDFENDPDEVTARCELLLSAAVERERTIQPGHFRYLERPWGTDLTDPRNASWLFRVVASVRPDLLVIGPLYKMHGPNSEKGYEDTARSVQVVIDRIRERVGCAVVIEHHMGNEDSSGRRQARPYGASMWRRWISIGLALKPPKDSQDWRKKVGFELVDWRGRRSPRDWPETLRWRREAEKGFPWVEQMEDD